MFAKGNAGGAERHAALWHRCNGLMKPLAIFFGSTTGNTDEAAKDIAAAFKRQTDLPVELIDVCRMDPKRLLEYDRFLVGCPTWDIGELQGDWDRLHRKLGSMSFDGKTIALFGCGDALGYADTFQDALGILGKDFRDRGATLVGKWSTEGYTFEASLGVEDGYFLGLALDYENDFSTWREQINNWVTQLVEEMALPVKATA
jgi:flavodoxin I